MKQASELIARTCGGLALCALLGHAAPAYAQSAEDKETARQLFEDGKTKRDRGNFAGALEAFKAADALMNVPTTKLAVARAYASLGKLTEARDAAVKIAELPVAAKEPQPFADARAAGAQMAIDLAKKIPSIAIELKGAPADPETVVTVDGAVIPKEAVSAPRRVNPGIHVVVARLGGGEVSSEFNLAEAERRPVLLDVTALAARLPKAAAPAHVAEPDNSDPTQRKISPVVWVGLGVAGVGLAFGAVGGLLSMSKKSDADAVCRDSKCPPQGYDALDSSKTLATISTVGFVAAGIGAGVAAFGYFVLSKKPVAAQTGALHVSPWIGIGGAGASGTF